MLAEAREVLEFSEETGGGSPASLKVFTNGDWTWDGGDDKRMGEDTAVPATLLEPLCFPFALELAMEPSLS